VHVRSFNHTGITVADFNRAVRFYWDVFGCPLVGVSDAPQERVRTFFGVNAPSPSCKLGWIRVPGGAVLEIFQFQPGLLQADLVWNRAGLTHLCFNVRNIDKWHAYLLRKRVEIVSPPERSPHGHTLLFAKDPDGNLIELTDLRHMHYVLRWLGPLGGWLFRRGIVQDYRRYYESSPGD